MPRSKKGRTKPGTKSCTETYRYEVPADEDICEAVADLTVKAGTDRTSLHPTINSMVQRMEEKTNLDFALKVVEGKETHVQMNKKIYEAGIIMCVVITIDYLSRQQGSDISALLKKTFPKPTYAAIMGLWVRLRMFLKAIADVLDEEKIPKQLDVSMLPVDASCIWNDDIQRISAAFTSIPLHDPDRYVGEFEYLLYNMVNGKLVISTIKHLEIVVPLTCGVCFEAASYFDKCGVGKCRYVVCKACKSAMSEQRCPFCRQPWH